MSVADVDGLVWWEWRLLVEGLDAEARAAAGEQPRLTPGSTDERAAETALLARAGIHIVRT